MSLPLQKQVIARAYQLVEDEEHWTKSALRVAAVAVLQMWLATAPSYAQEKCNTYNLGPGRESVELAGVRFTVYAEKASKPIGFNCRPRSPSVRASDGTPGAVSCANLRSTSTIAAGHPRPILFAGDANFIYEIRLKEPSDQTTVRVCVH